MKNHTTECPLSHTRHDAASNCTFSAGYRECPECGRRVHVGRFGMIAKHAIPKARQVTMQEAPEPEILETAYDTSFQWVVSVSFAGRTFDCSATSRMMHGGRVMWQLSGHDCETGRVFPESQWYASKHGAKRAFVRWLMAGYRQVLPTTMDAWENAVHAQNTIIHRAEQAGDEVAATYARKNPEDFRADDMGHIRCPICGGMHAVEHDCTVKRPSAWDEAAQSIYGELAATPQNGREAFMDSMGAHCPRCYLPAPAPLPAYCPECRTLIVAPVAPQHIVSCQECGHVMNDNDRTLEHGPVSGTEWTCIPCSYAGLREEVLAIPDTTPQPDAECTECGDMFYSGAAGAHPGLPVCPECHSPNQTRNWDATSCAGDIDGCGSYGMTPERIAARCDACGAPYCELCAEPGPYTAACSYCGAERVIDYQAIGYDHAPNEPCTKPVRVVIVESNWSWTYAQPADYPLPEDSEPGEAHYTRCDVYGQREPVICAHCGASDYDGFWSDENPAASLCSGCVTIVDSYDTEAPEADSAPPLPERCASCGDILRAEQRERCGWCAMSDSARVFHALVTADSTIADLLAPDSEAR